MTNQSLTLLVYRARKGDEDAINQLIKLVEKRGKSIALEYTDYDDFKAQDILQNAYIRAFENLGSLKDPEKFEHWFYVIVHNQGKNAATPSKIDESSSNFSELGEEDMDFEEIAPGDYIPFQPKENFDQSELKKGIRNLLESLSKDQRIAVKAFFFDGLNMREIADTLGVGESTVRMRIKSAKSKMAGYIDEMERKGMPLFGAVPASVFSWFFEEELQNVVVAAPDIHAIMEAAGFGKTAAKVSTATEAEKVETTVSSTAAKKTGVGFLKTGIGKVVVGLAIIGTVGTVIAVNANGKTDNTEAGSQNNYSESFETEEEADWKREMKYAVNTSHDEEGYEYYYLYDVDKDGIPELFIGNASGYYGVFGYEAETVETTGYKDYGSRAVMNYTGTTFYVKDGTNEIYMVCFRNDAESELGGIYVFSVNESHVETIAFGYNSEYYNGTMVNNYQWNEDIVTSSEFYDNVLKYLSEDMKPVFTVTLNDPNGCSGYDAKTAIRIIDEW